MNLLETKAAFRAGTLEKHDYIRRMHEWHFVLFQYRELMRGTQVSRIEITDDEVIMTARDTGVRIVCDPADHRVAPVEILNFDAYEVEDARMIRALVAPGQRVFDVGANYGWYSLDLVKTVPGVHIDAFEPVPKTFAYLKRNVELNAAQGITLHNFGLSTKAETKTFYFYPEGSGNASLANLSDRKDVVRLDCELRRMDDVVREGRHTVDFIKCDVEGAELFVFQGGVETLRAQRPVVFTEMLRKWAAKFDYHPNRILELFTSLGYRCFTAKGGRLAPFATMDENTVETNFFFLHPEKHRALLERHGPGAT